MNIKFLVLTGLLGVLAGGTHAATINGSFSIDGSITVSLNTITWTDNLDVADMYVVGPPAPTGTWSSMALDSEGTVQDLSLATEPVGTAFSDPDWMTFSGLPDLTITLEYIYAGTDGTADCTATPAPGQACTPLAGNGLPGPFDLQNSASGTTSSATFTFRGIATDSSGTLANTEVIGQFSSDFSTPYQDILATLATNGSVTNTYAATFSSVIPEPGSVGLAGLGIILIGLARSRRKHGSTGRFVPPSSLL